ATDGRNVDLVVCRDAALFAVTAGRQQREGGGSGGGVANEGAAWQIAHGLPPGRFDSRADLLTNECRIVRVGRCSWRERRRCSRARGSRSRRPRTNGL